MVCAKMKVKIIIHFIRSVFSFIDIVTYFPFIIINGSLLKCVTVTSQNFQ